MRDPRAKVRSATGRSDGLPSGGGLASWERDGACERPLAARRRTTSSAENLLRSGAAALTTASLGGPAAHFGDVRTTIFPRASPDSMSRCAFDDLLCGVLSVGGLTQHAKGEPVDVVLNRLEDRVCRDFVPCRRGSRVRRGRWCVRGSSLN